ncbi:flagellar filament outer layer protein FlaA [Spirochaeta africana]|uniref:Flagellar filament outer layer protein Flaa n=1 Tax=Spirochaeta africana (strain ATCC 700263 / DSM 8902 / Z-7692) TaxID=889378 RepID=H9UJN6_SPIAZ|nr:flagellar filament outer layer protein FlaA [Spirochaeta africana]AFG37729.1 Flagellar filament outer layer protein Flaa [Spirochaeta africana DSM 8902]
MKRIFTLITILLVLVSTTAFAERQVLIDFAELVPNWPADQPTDHEATLLDYSDVAGASFTEDELALMKSSLAIENWEVVLSSSSRNPRTMANSFVREAPVREGASRYENETVMGVRVHFPSMNHNAYAEIRPPFSIPAYMDAEELDADGNLIVPQDEVGRGRKFDNLGVVKNVGVLKEIEVNIHGLNFPHGFSVVMEDQTGRTRDYFMGYLNFDGWRTMTWRNPNYLSDVRDRDLRRLPLYPNLTPYQKLVGFRIYRDANAVGGDFITYIKDVTLTFDRAVLDLERDFEDEQIWGILSEREAERRQAEISRLGEIQVLRFIEERRLHTDEDDDI